MRDRESDKKMRLVEMTQTSKKESEITRQTPPKTECEVHPHFLPLPVEKSLLGPPEAVLDHALGDVHAVDVLVVDAHHEGQGIPWRKR